MEIERELALLRESWTETFDQLFVLYEVAREVSSVLEIDKVLEHVVNHAFLLLESEAAAVFLVDQENKKLAVKIIKNEKSGEAKNRDVALNVGEGIAGEVARMAKPGIFPQGIDDKSFSAEARLFGITAPRNLLCVPITLRGGVVIGVIEVVNKKNGTFTSKDRDFLMAIANISALSIENAKIYKDLSNIEKYQSQLIESFPEGFIAINNQGKITHMNLNAQKLLGVTDAASYMNQMCSVALKEETELVGFINTALLEGQIQKWKEISLKLTGKMVYLFTFIFKGRDNSVLGVGAVIQDMIMRR